LFSHQVWDIPNTEKKVYLTFDDGPTPEVTEWVLSVLKQHNIKATFFCIGDNIRKYPELFQKVILEGHSIGNHTYNHLQGWKTSDKDYLRNIKECEEIISIQYSVPRIQCSDSSSWQNDKNLKAAPGSFQECKLNTEYCKLFRPPYGKIRPSQSAQLRKKGYKIIMWDILSADFDLQVSPEKCLDNVVKNTTQGSIIVFHDSKKAFRNLEYALPETIAILKEKGFLFDRID